MAKIFNSRIPMKHDIEYNWKKAENFIPLDGEIVVYDATEAGETIKEIATLVDNGRIEIVQSSGGLDLSLIQTNFEFTAQHVDLTSYQAGDILEVANGISPSTILKTDGGIFFADGRAGNGDMTALFIHDERILAKYIKYIKFENNLYYYYVTIPEYCSAIWIDYPVSPGGHVKLITESAPVRIKVGDGKTLVNNLSFFDTAHPIKQGFTDGSTTFGLGNVAGSNGYLIKGITVENDKLLCSVEDYLPFIYDRNIVIQTAEKAILGKVTSIDQYASILTIEVFNLNDINSMNTEYITPTFAVAGDVGSPSVGLEAYNWMYLYNSPQIGSTVYGFPITPDLYGKTLTLFNTYLFNGFDYGNALNDILYVSGYGLNEMDLPAGTCVYVATSDDITPNTSGYQNPPYMTYIHIPENLNIDGIYLCCGVASDNVYLTLEENQAVLINYLNPENGDMIAAEGATALGIDSSALGEGSLASGIEAEAWAEGSTAAGIGVIADVASETVIGQYNDISDERAQNALFVVGNGTDDANRNNAFIIDKNGNGYLGKEKVLVESDILEMKGIASSKVEYATSKSGTEIPQDGEVLPIGESLEQGVIEYYTEFYFEIPHEGATTDEIDWAGTPSEDSGNTILYLTLTPESGPYLITCTPITLDNLWSVFSFTTYVNNKTNLEVLQTDEAISQYVNRISDNQFLVNIPQIDGCEVWINCKANDTVSVQVASWLSFIPEVTDGSYLWTRTVTTYTDNTNTIAYSVSKMGENGTTPVKGTDYMTQDDIDSIVEAVLAALPNGDKVSY